MICLEIASKADLVEFVEEAKKVGLLKEVDIRSASEGRFPIRIPVNLDSILKLAGNPLIRKAFGKKIDTAVTSYLKETVT